MPEIKFGQLKSVGNPTGTITLSDAAIGGNVDGTVQYAYIEVVSSYTTGLSPLTSITVSNSQVDVTVPLPRSGVNSRRLFRTKKNGSQFFLVHDFGGGFGYFQTKWRDNTLDTSLTVPAPLADNTLFRAWELNESTKFLRTHPAGTPLGDLTVLTSDPSTQNSFAIDSFGPITARTTSSSNSYLSIITQLASGIYGGSHLLCTTISNTDQGQALTTVFQISAVGGLVFTPGTLGDPGLADGTSLVINSQSTAATTNTANLDANFFKLTGAGTSSFEQRCLTSQIVAGYTGSSATVGLFGLNQTASSGVSYGVRGDATGSSTFSVGIAGRATGGTNQIGVFGATTSAFDPSTLTLGTAGATAAVFTNGASSGDIIDAYSNTALVLRVKLNGNTDSATPSGVSGMTWNWTSTSGGGNFRLFVNGGSDAQLLTTNNIPVRFGANNTLRFNLATSGDFVGTTTASGLGYTTGTGGTVTQLTNKSTSVTLNTLCGTITLNSANLAADTSVSFTFTNSTIGTNDLVHIQHDSVGTLGAYSFAVTPASGSATVAVHNTTPAGLAEAIVLRFTVIRGAVS